MTDLDVRTVPLDAVTRTPAAIEHAVTLDPARPVLFGGTGSGKARAPLLPAVEAMLGNAVLRAAVGDLRREHDVLAGRYAALLTAAQAAVIESRTGRRNPVTPLIEALAGLGQLPEPGARLHETLPETAAAWPKEAGR